MLYNISYLQTKMYDIDAMLYNISYLQTKMYELVLCYY